MRRTWGRIGSVVIVVLAVAALAAAGNPGRTERAPGRAPVAAEEEAGDATRAVWPGPDGYGVTGSTCTYSWVDITGTGTAIAGLTDDNFMGPFPIGFSFPYYGATQTQFYASSNGYITFGAGSSSLSNQCPLPSSTTPDNLIAMVWDDLNFGTSGNAYYQHFAACPFGSGECTVVEYANLAHYGGAAGSAGTWEIILFADGTVVIQAQDSGTEMGSSSTTGIEGANFAGGHGLTYACDTASSVADNLCIELGLQAGINLGPDTLGGPACPGSATSYDMSLFNNSGAGATFDLSYSVTSGNASLTGPATVTVANGATGTFTVELTANAGLPNGTAVTGSVDASGGGFSDSSTLAATADSTLISAWPQLANTPQGTRFHASAHANGKVYQFAGETGWWTLTSAVQAYSVAGDSWTTIAAMPTPVYGAAAAAIGDTVYVVGGTNCTTDPLAGACAGTTFPGLVQVLDATTDTWSTDAANLMPTPVAFAPVVAAGGKLYVIGGVLPAGTAVGTVQVYDPTAASGSRWSTVASMPTARAYTTADAIGGSIYVAGGWTSGATNLSTLEVYSIAGDSWSAGTAMPVTAASLGGGALGVYLVAFADYASYDVSAGTTYSCSADVYVYDPAAATWSTVAVLPRCLYGHVAAGDGSQLWVVSGRTNDGGWHMALETLETAICGTVPVELMRFSVE